MAVKEVIKMGHPTLRLKAKALSAEEILSKETESLIQDMFDTMAEQDGIGIAAPQINVSKQIALVGLPPEGEEEELDVLIVINPKIEVLDKSEQGFWEGCLSVPGLRGFVERPKKVKITYQDIEAKEQHFIAEGFVATIFQHELDHLFGHIYVDHVKDKDKLVFNEEYLKYHAHDEEELD